MFDTLAGTVSADDPIDDFPAFDLWSPQWDNDAVHHQVTRAEHDFGSRNITFRS
jgi:hypothetical protein